MIGLFAAMRVTAVFLVLHLWFLLPHRYRAPACAGILAAMYALTTLLDLFVCQNITNKVNLAGNLALAAEVVLVLGAALLIGQHRDSRALLIGFSACACDLAGVAINCLLYFWSQSTALALAGSAACCAAALYFLVRGDRKTPLRDLLQNRSGRMKLCLVPLLTFLSFYVICVWPGNIFTVPECRVVLIIMILIMFGYYQLVLSLLRSRADSDALAGNNELLEAYVSSLKRQVADVRDAEEQLSILRHDMRHKDNMILYYLDAGNTDAVRTMVSDTVQQLDATAQKRYCRNGVLNMILTQTDRRAKQQGVVFRCSADIPEPEPGVPPEMEFEFGTIVLNLLENALRVAAALSDPQRRWVRFTAYRIKGQMFLEAANPYDGVLRLSPDTGLPQTTQGDGHGYGLRSVRAFVKKHSASLDFDTGNGIFCARILLPLRDPQS